MPNQPSVIFDSMSDSAFVRASQLVRGVNAPNAPIPFSEPTLWRKVKEGTFPAPVKLSRGVTAWRVGDLRVWVSEKNKAEHSNY
jgi:prophage regulatory protein